MKRKTKADLQRENEQLHSRIAELEGSESGAEAKARENYALLQAVIEGTPDPVFLKDRDSRYRLLNTATARALGKESVEQVIGKDDTALLPLDLAHELQENDRKIIDSGEAVEYEEWVGAAEAPRLFRTVKTPYRDETGAVAGIIGVARDITERKRAEEELKAANQQLPATEQQLRASNQQLGAANQQLTATEKKLRGSEDRLRLALSAADMGTWRWVPATNEDTRDGSFNRILGLEPVDSTQPVEDFVGRVHPEDRPSVETAIETAAREKKAYVADFRIVRPDGEVRWLYDRGMGTYDDKGEMTHMTGAVLDITERKRLEEQRDRILALSNDLICIAGMDGYFKYVNPAWEGILGYTEEELLSRPFLDFIHPDDHVKNDDEVESLSEGKPSDGFENRYIHKDGSVRTISWKAMPLPERKELYCVGRDITDRKLAEEEAREAEESYSRILKGAPTPIIGINADASVGFVNPALEQLTGFPRSELVGRKPPYPFWSTSKQEETLGDLTAAMRKGAKGLVEEFQTKDGRPLWVEITSIPVVQDGELVYYIANWVDITERRLAERALNERVKELTCLHELARVVEEEDASVEDILAGSVNLLPPAWRFPEDATARIVWDGRSFQSGEFPDTAARLSAPLLVQNHEAGRVEVAYHGHHPDADEGPFLKEERALLETFTERLGKIAERIQAQEELASANQQLQASEQQLRASNEQLATSNREIGIWGRISHIFLSVPDEEMYNEVLKVVLEEMDSKFGVFGYLDEAGAFVVPSMTRHVWKECNVPDKTIVFPRDKWGSSSWPRAIREKKTNYTNEPSSLTPEGHIAIDRHISLPILHRGEVVGLFQVANKETDYTEQDLALLENIGRQIAPVLVARLRRERAESERKRQEAELRAANQQLEASTQQLRASNQQLGAANQQLEAGNQQLRATEQQLRAANQQLAASEKQLREERYRYETLVNSIPDAVYSALPDESGTTTFMSGRWEEWTGYSPEDFYRNHETWPKSIHPDDLEEAVGGYIRACREGEDYEAEYRLVHKDTGETRWVRDHGVAAKDESRTVIRVDGVVTDITDRKQAAEALQNQLALNRTITDNAASCLFMMDKRGHATFMNPAAEKVTGYSLDEIRDMPLHDAIHHKYPDGRPYPMSECPIDNAQADLVSMADYEDIFVRKDGSLFPVVCHIEPLEQSGEVVGSVLEFRDVTDRKRAEEELEKHREHLEELVEQRTAEVRQYVGQLEAANKELEAFAYSVSHDLRAPLRGMDGFSEALLQDYGDKLNATGKDYARRVRAASQKMGQLIDDMLQLSRVTRHELKRETVDLSGLAHSAVDRFQKGDRERQVEIAIEGGIVVEGDFHLLSLVLENLLSNAWKFTEKEPAARIEFGAVRNADCGLRNAELDDDVTVYFVRDNGAGFDMEYADKLFQPFQRLHSESEFSGTGIGLATVQRIIARHGGRVWAEGKVGKGATLYFTF